MNPVIVANGDITTRFLAVQNWLQKELGFSPNNIMPTMLQSFAPLSATNNSYSISMCQKFINTSALSADTTLNLVGQNDAFAAVGVRQVIRKRYATAGTNTGANCDIVSNPDPYLFDATGELAQIRSVFYGSKSALQVETTTVIEALLGTQLGFAGTPQTSATTSSATGSASQFDRVVPLYRDIVFSGLTNVSFQTVLQGFTLAAAITGDTNEANDIGFQVWGFTIKGAGQQVSDLANQQNTNCLLR